MTGKLPGHDATPSSLLYAWPKAMHKEGKGGSGAMIVAIQSCFHRDMLDGEQIASKALKFHL
jgi:hypothetical protein